MVSFRNRPESVPLQLKQPVRVVKWISTVKSWRWTNTATLALNGWSQRGTLVYYVFDLLMLDGKDLRLLPLMKRKERLARLKLNTSNATAWRWPPEAAGLEGIIAKDAKSPASRVQACRR